MAEHKGDPARRLPSQGIVVLLKWAMVIAFALLLLVSLFLCWRLQKQLDEVREEEKQVKRELAGLDRIQVVEQSGVFKLEGDAKPVYFPRPYGAPPAITVERIVSPFPNVGGELDEAKLKQQQIWFEEREVGAFDTAMKAFDLVNVYADHFRWKMHADRVGGSYPNVVVRWRARGLMAPSGRPAK